jgi:two-component sensor histidine kinase
LSFGQKSYACGECGSGCGRDASGRIGASEGMRSLDISRRDKWRHPSPGSAEAFLIATIFVVIAGMARWLLGFVTQDLQAFTTFYPAVLFATLLGGAGPGIFAAFLGGFVSWWEFLQPYTSLLPLSPSDEINLLTYFVASIVIVWAADHYRRLTKRLQDEESFRKLSIDELAHRLKNKVATIQSIISFRLREYPEVRADIFRSLAALMATDDLITAAQGEGARLRDILSAEVLPYDMSRISMLGPDCFLPPKLALTMALIVHELTTNAAKYGALSISNGKLSIDWSVSDRRLNIIWRESDGPLVDEPSHGGFGTRLFKRALEQFDGQVDTAFEPSGLVCRLSVILPSDSSVDTREASSERREVP